MKIKIVDICSTMTNFQIVYFADHILFFLELEIFLSDCRNCRNPRCLCNLQYGSCSRIPGYL